VRDDACCEAAAEEDRLPSHQQEPPFISVIAPPTLDLPAAAASDLTHPTLAESPRLVPDVGFKHNGRSLDVAGSWGSAAGTQPAGGAHCSTLVGLIESLEIQCSASGAAAAVTEAAEADPLLSSTTAAAAAAVQASPVTALLSPPALRGIKVQGKLAASADDLYAAIFGSGPPPSSSPPQRQPSHSLQQQPSGWGSGRLPVMPRQASGLSFEDSSSGGLPVLPHIRTARISGSDGGGSCFAPDAVTCSSSGGWPQGGPAPIGCSSPVASIHSRGSASSGGQQQQQQRLWGSSSAGASGAPMQRMRSLQRMRGPHGMGSGSWASLGGSAAAGSSSNSGINSGTMRSASMPGSHPGCARNLFGPPLGQQHQHQQQQIAPWPSVSGKDDELPSACGSSFGTPSAAAIAASIGYGGVSAARDGFGFGCGSAGYPSSLADETLSVASDDDCIREINADNVLSSHWGPPASAAKLLGFKYSAAMSPLGAHGGRSPFASPRHQQKCVVD